MPGPARLLLLAAAAGAGVWGCARQGAPPGGPGDRIPPFVVRTEPDTFALVEAFDGSVEVEFNERISERVSGSLDRAVEVSPRSGEVRVDHKRRGLGISMEGGFRENRVYRITVLPVVADMFGNTVRDPFEFFFSTGPEFNPNALAGVLTDRITGQPVSGARVDAWRADEDSVIYTAVSDDDGIFALRTLPEGAYTLQAYTDVNRNFEANFIEPQARSTSEPLGAADTAIVFLALLQPDTTPGELLSVTALDSTTLELGFDDYLDPDSTLAGVSVTLARDTADVAAGAAPGAPTVSSLLHPPAYEEMLRVQAELAAIARDSAAAADTLVADTLVADTTAPQVAAPTERAPGAPETDARAEEVLPSQLVYALLDGPLEPAARYTVTVTGVANIAGVAGGGGEVQVEGPEPPPPPEPDSLAADSAAVGRPGAPPEGSDTLPAAPPEVDTVPAASPPEVDTVPAASPPALDGPTAGDEPADTPRAEPLPAPLHLWTASGARRPPIATRLRRLRD